MIRFSLDGREVEASPGESIWAVAQREDVEIPHLCHRPEPGYRPDGNCRACMVEIEGERVLAASCIRAPREGMVVRTASERAKKTRRMVFELLLADQPLVGAEAVGRLVGAFEDGARVAVATYGGEPRNPALFAREVWPLLRREMSGDRGARAVLSRHPDLITEVPCDDVADPADVDTVEDLRRIEGELTVPGRSGTTGQRRSL